MKNKYKFEIWHLIVGLILLALIGQSTGMFSILGTTIEGIEYRFEIKEINEEAQIYYDEEQVTILYVKCPIEKLGRKTICDVRPDKNGNGIFEQNEYMDSIHYMLNSYIESTIKEGERAYTVPKDVDLIQIELWYKYICVQNLTVEERDEIKANYEYGYNDVMCDENSPYHLAHPEDNCPNLWQVCYKDIPSEYMVISLEDELVGMANPSAVYCEEQGYEYKIITNPDGSQYGMCGTCRAWDFYNGECKQGFNWYSWAPEIGNLTQKQSALIIFGVIGLILFLLVRKK